VSGFVDRRVDQAAAHEVAAAYLDAPGRRDPLTAAAYSRLVTESDRFFRRITSPGRPDAVRVDFTTCPTPYGDAHEVIRSVADDRVLEVSTVAADPDRRHPLMGSEVGGAYDRFRTVHDILGHARLGLGFDRHGEFAVWLSQERFHGPLARRALATELHGQHSVYWTTGEMAEPKAVLLDPGLLRRSRLLGAPPVASTSLSPSPRGTPPPSRVATLLPEAVTTSCRSTPRRCSSNASTSSPTSGAS
jgi:hypothetical protein